MHNALSQPLTLPYSHKSSPNRILKAAITERLCTSDGKPTREFERVYETWGAGRLGIMHTGNIMVHRAHLEAPGNAILDKDDRSEWHVPALRRVTEAAKRGAMEAGCPPSLLMGQLAHLGGQAFLEAEYGKTGTPGERPDEWTEEGIRDMIERFAYAAWVLYNAGFDGVQIHVAYNNFLTMFLSSESNTRSDAYGGPIHNRARFLLEIISAIHKRIDDQSFSVSVKFYTTDFLKGGLSEYEVHTLGQLLDDAKLDYLELSGGTYEGVTDDTRPTSNPRQSYFLSFCRTLRSSLTHAFLITTSGFITLSSMSHTIDHRKAELIGLGRSLCHHPHLCHSFLDGSTNCVPENKLPKDTAVQLDAGIEQVGRMGSGEKLLDFGKEEVVKQWLMERERKKEK